MTLADMNKWTSGETEVFFDPRQTPSAAGGDNNSGGEKLTARPSIHKSRILPSPPLLEPSLPSLWFILLF
jgi:hypothetical protein